MNCKDCNDKEILIFGPFEDEPEILNDSEVIVGDYTMMPCHCSALTKVDVIQFVLSEGWIDKHQMVVNPEYPRDKYCQKCGYRWDNLIHKKEM